MAEKMYKNDSAGSVTKTKAKKKWECRESMLKDKMKVW